MLIEHHLLKQHLIVYDCLIPVTLYLLRNGTDVPDCGNNVTAACASFPYLLGVFYSEYKPELPTLEVIMDVSVRIDKDLQVKGKVKKF